MIIYIKNPKESTKIKLLNKFNKVERYKINI